MPRSAFPVTPRVAGRKGRQRVAALVAGAATVIGVSTALATPAASAQDCGGAGQFGSGNRACEQSTPTPVRASGAIS